MPDVSSDRIAAIAAAARVVIEPETAARVAGAVAPTVARYGAAAIAVPFEIEPSSFAAVQRREIGR